MQIKKIHWYYWTEWTTQTNTKSKWVWKFNLHLALDKNLLPVRYGQDIEWILNRYWNADLNIYLSMTTGQTPIIDANPVTWSKDPGELLSVLCCAIDFGQLNVHGFMRFTVSVDKSAVLESLWQATLQVRLRQYYCKVACLWFTMWTVFQTTILVLLYKLNWLFDTSKLVCGFDS